MSGLRLPGPVCRLLGALEIDAGTLCISSTPSPGPLGAGFAARIAPPPPCGGAPRGWASGLAARRQHLTHI